MRTIQQDRPGGLAIGPRSTRTGPVVGGAAACVGVVARVDTLAVIIVIIVIMIHYGRAKSHCVDALRAGVLARRRKTRVVAASAQAAEAQVTPSHLHTIIQNYFC